MENRNLAKQYRAGLRIPNSGHNSLPPGPFFPGTPFAFSDQWSKVAQKLGTAGEPTSTAGGARKRVAEVTTNGATIGYNRRSAFVASEDAAPKARAAPFTATRFRFPAI